MARAPLLQLTDVSLTFGGNPVFEDLSLTIQPGDRLALVGRNGSGKSTLMKVMAGLVEQDRGERVVSASEGVGYMEQDPDMTGCTTLGDFALRDLDASDLWRVEAVAEGLKFDPGAPVVTASGGERRRAALAKLLAEAPSAKYCVELTVTEAALVATGPADRHRLSPAASGRSLRPLVEFETVAVD